MLRHTGCALALLACACALAAAEESDGTPAEESSSSSSTSFTFDGFARAFGESFGVILATEVGDRTFFIAAIMAMRHSRLVIWFGAVGALVVMTVLSTLVGHVAPLLISRKYTQYAAAGLFLFFGVRMLRDGMKAERGVASEELEEVEQELTKKQARPPTPPARESTLRGLPRCSAQRTPRHQWHHAHLWWPPTPTCVRARRHVVMVAGGPSR